MKSLLSTPGFALISALTLTAAGCATEAKYNAKVQTWVGRTAESVTQSWGPPDVTEKRPNGDQVMVYARLKRRPVSYREAQRELASNSPPVNTGPVYIKCATYFEVSPAGDVVKTLFRGDECVSRY